VLKLRACGYRPAQKSGIACPEAGQAPPLAAQYSVRSCKADDHNLANPPFRSLVRLFNRGSARLGMILDNLSCEMVDGAPAALRGKRPAIAGFVGPLMVIGIT